MSQLNGKIRVLLVEDHRVTRLGLRCFLDEYDDVEVVGEAGDGIEAVEQAESLQPDVILMDVQMPRMDGIQASREIRKSNSDVRIVIVTTFDQEREVFAALSAGANGYCLKDVSDDRLYTAIISVFKGDIWLDAAIAGKVFSALPQIGDPSESHANHGGGELSARELDVLRLIVEGRSNSEIAKLLVITGDTVKSHIKHILEKLAVSDRTQAAVKALRDGLV
jgi:Response regulator containing a CheY-like receiver domain and an HTH DNA-binding domain